MDEQAQKNRRIHSCGECTGRLIYASLQYDVAQLVPSRGPVTHMRPCS
jgi:hypothetical protein